MKRGEIYWAKLAPRSHSEQKGRRPVLILSHDGFNEVDAWRSIIVVPLSTSGKQAARSPTVVVVPRGTGGLSAESVVLGHQITTLDRSKLEERIGALPTKLLKAVEQAVKTAIDVL
jgi:mRNA interferase MazF